MLIDDAHDDLHKIENLYKRWLLGGSGAKLTDHCIPQSWHAVLDGDTDAQGDTQQRRRRQALILSAQQQAWLLRKQAPDALYERERLPCLSLPSLDETLRPVFRRCLEHVQALHGQSLRHLLNLMATRGVTAHPVDWLPRASDDVPAIYWPWSRWVSHQSGMGIEAHANDPITEVNWDDFYPAQRVARLKAMRLQDADVARDVIASCMGREPADKRFNIIEALAINLSQNDHAFLASLSSDRSKKIQQLARQFLMRLGVTVDSHDNAQHAERAGELAEWLLVKKTGVINQCHHIKPARLKSKKQQALRSEWIEQIPLKALSDALSLPLETLVSGWQFSAHRNHDNHCFVTNAAQHLPDALIEKLLASLLTQMPKHPESPELIQLLLPRLDHDVRVELMLTLLNSTQSHFSFHDCLHFIDAPLATLDWTLLKKTTVWKGLISALREQINDEANHRQVHSNTHELAALGLLIPKECAEQVHRALLEIGMMPVDPALDLIKFNLQLPGRVNDQV